MADRGKPRSPHERSQRNTTITPTYVDTTNTSQTPTTQIEPTSFGATPAYASTTSSPTYTSTAQSSVAQQGGSSQQETKIKSAKDIRFPFVDRIMGLPPIGLETDAEYFETKEFLEASFPILRITANFYEWDDVGKPLNVQKISPEYKFAVMPDSQINYAHTNQYAASNIENDMASLMRFNTAGEIRQLMRTTGGVLKANLSKGQDYLDTLMSRLSTVLSEAAKQSLSEEPAIVMTSLGTDVARGIVAGARIDLPDIWQNSSTTQNWTFTIDLRTMATDPNSELYRRDIIEPLEILLKLSLPVGGYNISYLEPPYISARLGNFLDVKMGGISNIVWTAPLNEFNLNETPRHIEVSITIQDLYSVIVQSGSANEDFPTLERHIENFTKNYKDRISGKTFSKIFTHEYRTGSHESRDIVAEPKQTYQPNYTSIEHPSVAGATFSEVEMLDKLGDTKINTIGMSFNKSTNTFKIYAPSLNDAEIFKIDNVTNITGNALSYNFLNSKETATYDISAIKQFKISGVNNIKEMSFPSLLTNTANSFNRVFTDNNVALITNNVLNTKPQKTLDQLAVLNQMTTESIDGYLSENADNLTTLFDISDNIVKSLGSQMISMITNTEPTESLASSTIRRIKFSNPMLDNQLRYSKEAQMFIEHISDLYTSKFVNNDEIREEYVNLNASLPRSMSSQVSRDLITAMSSIFTMASLLMYSNSMNSILSPKYQGVDRSINIHLEV